MREKSRIVVGINETWAVADQALNGDLEVKYTVDSVGTELLLYRDSVAPRVLSHDRLAVMRSRIIGVMPAVLRRALGRMMQGAPRSRMLVRDRVQHRRARSSRLRRAGLVPVGSACAPHYATEVADHDSLTEENFQRDRVLALLRGAAVQAAVLPAGRGKRAVVVIRDADRRRAVAALSRALGRPWYVVPLDAPSARPRPVSARRLQRLCARSDGFRLFRYVAAGPDRPVAGAVLGCDVEVWRAPRHALLDRPGPARDFSGRLVAPRRNAWATQLGADTWVDAGSRAGHLVDVGSLPHIFGVIGPVDVIYTWVDGSDPRWRARHREALDTRDAESAGDGASDPARFRSHDELKYSLRSLEIYAPWVRKVHLVTDGQRPEWLNLDHPKLHVVDHREIFADSATLPVFNSHAIESRLHHVPGLAERYLYLNDDVFLGRPVTKDLFFHGNGLSKFFLSTAVIGLGARNDGDDTLAQVAKNNRAVIDATFDRTITHTFQHAPHPQLRSVVEQMEREHPEVFARVAASRFRSPDDVSIASALHHYYGYNLGRSVPGRLEYLYLDFDHPGAPQRLERLLRTREFDVFCINDTPAPISRTARYRSMLGEFMERYYPLASSFER